MKSPLFSRRTCALLLILIGLTVVLGVIAHRRQALCGEVRHGFARRSPIAGASGTDTFVCPEMYKGAPLGDKVLAVLGVFAVLALMRSVLMDREAWRRRRHTEYLE